MENLVPSMCRIRPGLSISVEQYTTQPIARSTGRIPLTAPSGSTDSMRRPSNGPVRPWKYHQGMPFWAATIAVCSPSSGEISGWQVA